MPLIISESCKDAEDPYKPELVAKIKGLQYFRFWKDNLVLCRLTTEFKVFEKKFKEMTDEFTFVEVPGASIKLKKDDSRDNSSNFVQFGHDGKSLFVSEGHQRLLRLEYDADAKTLKQTHEYTNAAGELKFFKCAKQEGVDILILCLKSTMQDGKCYLEGVKQDDLS